jgi:hypothetical protein
MKRTDPDPIDLDEFMYLPHKSTKDKDHNTHTLALPLLYHACLFFYTRSSTPDDSHLVDRGPRGSPRTPGRVLDIHKRTLALLGRAFVDNPDLISAELANEVTNKAFKLLIRCRRDDETIIFEGQVGYIRGEPLGIIKVETNNLEHFENRFVAIPVTALHHVTNQPDTNSGAIIEVLSVDVAWPQIQRLNFTMFEKLGTALGPSVEIRNNMVWKHGIDIARGKRVGDNIREVTSGRHAFPKVRDDFEYQLGQCVGIAVCSEVGATTVSAQAPAGTDEALIGMIYGAANRVNIYAGRINLSERGTSSTISTLLAAARALCFF